MPWSRSDLRRTRPTISYQSHSFFSVLHRSPKEYVLLRCCFSILKNQLASDQADGRCDQVDGRCGFHRNRERIEQSLDCLQKIATFETYAELAQLVERRLPKPKGTSSTLAFRSSLKSHPHMRDGFMFIDTGIFITHNLQLKSWHGLPQISRRAGIHSLSAVPRCTDQISRCIISAPVWEGNRLNGKQVRKAA